MKISAVVHTHNEAANIERCLTSLLPYVDEIIVVDMESSDQTVKLARQYTKKILKHPFVGYVEPARNFAIAKARFNWIFILDADEVLSSTLGITLKRLAEHGTHDFYRLPRKNIIFGKWIEHSGWWPDYLIRFFKKGCVTWFEDIHSVPITQGSGMDVTPNADNAIVHYNYQTVDQFIERINRYTSEEAKEKLRDKYQFKWENLLMKPANEFLMRYFSWEGYKDGVHGLALSLLQSVAILVLELKVWEAQKFTEEHARINLSDVYTSMKKITRDYKFWHFQKLGETVQMPLKFIHKLRSKTKI